MAKKRSGGNVLGDNLKRLRAERGLSGRDIEEATGGVVQQADVSRIESGTTGSPGSRKLVAIARALNVPVGVLLGGGGSVDDSESLAEFLASPFGKGLSDDQKAWLRSIQWPENFKPSLRSWVLMLEGYRAGDTTKGGK